MDMDMDAWMHGHAWMHGCMDHDGHLVNELRRLLNRTSEDHTPHDVVRGRLGGDAYIFLKFNYVIAIIIHH